MSNERKPRTEPFWRFIALIAAVTLITIFQLSCGSNKDASYPNIFAAINNGDIQAVNDFIRKNPASATAADKNGLTPLHFAASTGRREIAELLIAKGADVNAVETVRGFAPLHKAAGRGHREVLELLISKGADVNAKTTDGETPLHEAAENGHMDAAEPLISKGADVNAKTEDGVTPLGMAKTEEMKDLLCKHGAKE